MQTIDFSSLNWINKPQKFEISSDKLTIITEPQTDLWQRTYYGFCRDNAHSLLMPTKLDSFTMQVKTNFVSNGQYDQCGIYAFVDNENWIKSSCEFETSQMSRMGSVVTNLGYSDWASTEISGGVTQIYYRLHKRGQDFCIESSFDGNKFFMMRYCHLHKNFDEISVGVYACSPTDSSMKAEFYELLLGDCLWKKYC